jgi:hypothetical protein
VQLIGQLPRVPDRSFQDARPSGAGGDAKRSLTTAKHGKFQKLSGKEMKMVPVLVVPKAQGESLGVGRLIPDLLDAGNLRKENIIHAISPS